MRYLLLTLTLTLTVDGVVSEAKKKSCFAGSETVIMESGEVK
jgi:hypothetical protein